MSHTILEQVHENAREGFIGAALDFEKIQPYEAEMFFESVWAEFLEGLKERDGLRSEVVRFLDSESNESENNWSITRIRTNLAQWLQGSDLGEGMAAVLKQQIFEEVNLQVEILLRKRQRAILSPRTMEFVVPA